MRNKGDTIPFAFTIKQSGVIIPREEISDIVFQINNDEDTKQIELLLSRNEINYDVDGQFYYFELSQEQTFGLKSTNQYQVRVYGINQKYYQT